MGGGLAGRSKKAQRIVVDTNVFVAAKFNPRSHSRKLIADCVKGKFLALYSEKIRSELEAVVYKIRSREEFHPLVEEFFDHAHNVEPHATVDICQDAGDNRLLECAFAANADYVVTSDRAVLAKDGHDGLRIVSPAQFYKEAGG